MHLLFGVGVVAAHAVGDLGQVGAQGVADGGVETLRANARVTDPGNNARFRFTLTGLLGVGGLVTLVEPLEISPVVKDLEMGLVPVGAEQVEA